MLLIHSEENQGKSMIFYSNAYCYDISEKSNL